MRPADLDAFDRASTRRYDMEQFLAAHPEYRVRSVCMPTRHTLDGAPVELDHTDIRNTFARVRGEATPERTAAP